MKNIYENLFDKVKYFKNKIYISRQSKEEKQKMELKENMLKWLFTNLNLNISNIWEYNNR